MENSNRMGGGSQQHNDQIAPIRKDGLQNSHQLDNVNNNLNTTARAASVDQQIMLENSLNNNSRLQNNNFNPAVVDYYNLYLDVENNNDIDPSPVSQHLFVNPYFYSGNQEAGYIDETRSSLSSSTVILPFDPAFLSNVVSLSTGTETTGRVNNPVQFYDFPLDNCPRNSGRRYSDVISGDDEVNNNSRLVSDGEERVYKDRNSKLRNFKAKFVRNKRKKLKQFSNKISEDSKPKPQKCLKEDFSLPSATQFDLQGFGPKRSQKTAKPVAVKASKMSNPGSRIRGAAGRGGDMKDAMMRRPRRRINEKKQPSPDSKKQFIQSK